MSRRSERVGDVLREELNRLLLRELRDPRIGMATISRVEVSPDLQHARVYVSALGDEDERLQSVRTLERAAGFLRRHLAKSLDLRRTPELRFLLDRGTDHSLRISEILGESDVDAT